MRLHGRNLQTGVAGEDVAQLHQELESLGYPVPDSERRDRIFGVGTAEAVRHFQAARGLLSTGVVDSGTAALLDRAMDQTRQETVSMAPGRPAAPAPAPAPDDEATVVHRALEAIGIPIDEAEREQRVYGPTTTEAVSRLQSLVGVEPTGQVDETTLAMAKAALGRLSNHPGAVSGGGWVVTGVVSDPNGQPMARATVVVRQRQLREAHEVGRGTTDDDGRYQISYTPQAEPVDLQLEVLAAEGKPAYRSPVQHKVPRRAEIDLAMGGPGRAKPSEFADLGRAVAKRLGRLRPEELAESGEHRDISFLADDTGYARNSVAFYSVAHRLSSRTELAPELFYALIRQNVPADASAAVLAATSKGADLDKNADRLLKAIMSASPQARAGAVRAAIDSGVVPPDYAARAEADLARLGALSAEAALQSSHGMGKTPIAEVLTAAAVPAPTQAKFVALYAAADKPNRAFWRDLAGNPEFSKAEVATLRFAVQIGRHTRGHLPLVQKLLELRSAGRIKGTRDLARLTSADWKAMVRDGQLGIPANFTAQDDEQAVEAYAFLLERRFEAAHPTTAFSARLAADPASPLPAKGEVTAFLDANPQFSLVRSNVDSYLQANPQTLPGESREQVRESLLTSQRVLKLTNRYAIAKPLIEQEIRSAQQVYAMGRTEFVNMFKDNPEVGAAQAARVWAVSEQTYALALSMVMNHHAPMIGVDPAAVGGPAVAASLDGFPNLHTLFGSLDLCACKHCRSVLSPAAYFVDILHFLGKQKAAGGKTVQSVLLARRPDLTQIELTCPNTNTVMPYIDLVNELLEEAVAPPADPVAAARARQTTLTTEELNANPEHVNQAAYAKLASAVYPWTLPFDLPLLEARTYLGMLGTDRVALMRNFAAPAGVGTPQSIAIAGEGLGLSAAEAGIITGAAVHQPWEYWGLAETGNTVPDPVDYTIAYTGTWIQVLSRVRILLGRAGLTYEALARLLNTVFINPDGSVKIQAGPDDACDIGAMTVAGLTPAVLDRLHRFVRLQRVLGWDVYDTDSAITLLQPGTINTALLRQLFAVKSAMKRLALPAVAAMALLGRLETRQVPALPGEDRPRQSLYHKLFQNRAVLNPVDAVFELNPDGTEIAAIAGGPKLADHRATLVAAFEIGDADLVLAIEALTDGALTLANLGTLYRHAVLAQTLGLTMRELLILTGLIERETDATPFFEAVEPFDGTRPELLGMFCDEVERIKRTRFSITQLDYLLRHRFEATSGVAPDDVTVGTLLKSIRDKLVKLAEESDYLQLGTGQIVQELTNALGVPTATTADLTAGVIGDFLALPSIARNPSTQDNPIARDEPGFASYFTQFEALAKAASVLAGFGFTTEDAAWLRDHGVAAGWLDPATLPSAPTTTAQGRYAKWRRLADAAGVRAALPSDGTPFTSLMDLALGGASKADYLDALAARTGWARGSLETLSGQLGLAYPADYGNERALSRFLPAFSQLRRLGISADVGEWIGTSITAGQADAIKQSVKSRYTTQRWSAVAKPPRDVLREKQRDALVSYLLAHPPAGVKRWHNANDVYARYLIDVEMSACQGTSRIVQANATIQLFVQRCILNVEPEVVVDAEANPEWLQWKWMSRYRVWEANRKVFCYPENWISPALRRDKSPFYQEMENELLQSEVTKQTAEEAFRGYLEKLDAVARLEVIGLYHEEKGEDGPTVLHVIARKQGNPPAFYYRQWVDSSRWTAWTKVDLDIVSDHVLPVVWNRRLYLFWAVVTTKPDRTQENPKMELSASTPQKATVHAEVQLAWSELRGNKWQPTQTAPQTIIFPGEVDPFEVTVKSSIVEPLLRIDLFVKEPHFLYFEHKHFAQFVLGGVGNSVEAFAANSSGLGKAIKQTWNIGQLQGGQVKANLTPPTNSLYEANALIPWLHGPLNSTRPRVTACMVSQEKEGTLGSEILLAQADRYRLVVPHQQVWFDSSLPFFYADGRRSYFVIPTVYYRHGNYFTTEAPTYGYARPAKARYRMAPFYHAYVPLFQRELNRGGVDRLFRRQLQLDPAAVQGTGTFGFGSYYKPSSLVDNPLPAEGVDFEPEAGYSIYNWELFFHAPFAIGEALSRNQRFEEAKGWYEYIFNPTSTTKDPVPQRFWVTKPFYKMTAADYWKQKIENLMKLINAGDKSAEHQVAQWRANPFEPHIIAALRPVAYQRAIVMKYLDNIIAWGDQLFRQDTMESVNEATQLYVLAAELLGARPEIVPRDDDGPPMTYADLAPSLDTFSNAIAAAENALPPVQVNVPVDPNIPKLPVLPPLYFCVPPNEKLLGYWDTVADRLYKVRHCMNIEGVVRQLALFAPPIDPGLLVKAAAAGLDLGSVLNDTSSALPPYRFRVIVREAMELAESVRALGADLLVTLQLRDADKLDLLRSGGERKLQDRMREVQAKAVEEAGQQLEVLAKTRAVVDERKRYFDSLAEELMNTWEAVAMVLTAGSMVAQGFAIALDSAAGAAHTVVDLQFGGSGAGGSPHATVKFGGENVGNSAESWAKVAKVAAAVLQTGAAMSATTAQYQRRKEEWGFQRDSAAKELEQIAAQEVLAQIREEIAIKARDNHEIVASTTAAVDEFLHDKFTNRELYDWMVGQTSATYFQSYQLAYTVAKRAEQCLRRELGLRDSSYIQFGYWDSLKKGLLSADKLLFDLRRMEAAFLAQNTRQLELTKHISLLNLDPHALVALRTTGECTVTIPELLFDLDNPGHYARTIKTMGVTVPCVVGPYTGVPLTLTLLDNHIRRTTDLSPQYARNAGDDTRFDDDLGGVQAIVTSGAQNDAGMFEPRLEDERYLPFEGAGAISTWKIRLNPVYPQFDYRSISDVILHMRYEAADGGALLAAEAVNTVKAKLNEVALAQSRKGLYRLISARQEDSARWHRFLHPGGEEDQVFTLETPADRFAFFTNGMDIKVAGIDVLAKLSDPGDYTLVFTRPGAAAQTVILQPDPQLGGLHHFTADPLAPKSAIGRAPSAEPYPAWTFKLQKFGATDFRSLTPEEIEDLVIILRYEVAP